MSKEYYAFLIRIDLNNPVEKKLQKLVDDSAIENGRSLNKEVIEILKKHFGNKLQ